MSPSVDVNSFARRVLRATKNDQLSWAPATDNPNTYLASADAGAIRMSTVQVDDDAFATRFEILDAAGRVTEMRETDPTRPGPWSIGRRPSTNSMRPLDLPAQAPPL